MHYKKFGNTILVRVDKGEEIVNSLQKVCTENNVELAFINAIGACSSAELGYYDTKTKVYHKKMLNGEYEISSLLGNVSLYEDKPLLHLHIALSGPDYNIVGGHLISAVVSITCEVMITVGGTAEKKYNEETGANLLDI